MRRRCMSMWTVYERPTDLPDYYVARRWEIGGGHQEPAPTDEAIVAVELSMIREALALRGLTPIPRQPDDEPHIVECWL